jgi:predicted esterase
MNALLLLLATLLPQDRFQRVSPFEGVRWKGEVYEVQVGGTWYALEAVSDLPVANIVAFCKKTYGDRWGKRLDEDLFEILAGMGKAPSGKKVTLKVKTLDTGESKVLPDVEMTEAKRRAIWQGRRDAEEAPSEEFRAGGDANKRYFLTGPAPGAAAPAGGWGLVLVLPGGDGSAEFQPFVKNIWKSALKDRYLVAQLVAVEWTPGRFNRVVWPTEKLKADGMKFTTEEFAEAVVAEVAKKHEIDRKRVFSLGWSSGGPPSYLLSLREKKVVAGSFVAMSVFHAATMKDALPLAKGHAYFLYHSPDDTVCPMALAKQAVETLKAQGAAVELKTYSGGHGWRGDTMADLRAGFEWLEKNAK